MFRFPLIFIICSSLFVFAFGQSFDEVPIKTEKLPNPEALSPDELSAVRLTGGRFLPYMQLQPASLHPGDLFLLSLLRPLDDDLECSLERSGLKLVDTFDGIHYWAVATSAAIVTQPCSADGFLLNQVDPLLKVDINLQEIAAIGKNKRTSVNVFYRSDSPVEPLVDLLIALSASEIYIDTEYPLIYCQLGTQHLATLASNNQVLSLEWAGTERTVFNNKEARITKTINSRNTYDLNGNSITVGIWDSGLVFAGHREFGGRVMIWGANSDVGSHATHVAGTVAAGGMNANARGMAPEAKIISYDAFNDKNKNPVGDIKKAFKNKMIQVVNNSWGYLSGWSGEPVDLGRYGYPGHKYHVWYGNIFGTYNADCRKADDAARNARAIIVFSAGNDRNDTFPGGEYYDPKTDLLYTWGASQDGPYGIIQPPGSAKNVITVGATDGPKGMSVFSNWGPGAEDGRLKPEICAPGVAVYSTVPGNKYVKMSGTSMASPVVTGALAVIVEQWRNHTNTYPTPEVIRAILAATADEAGLNGPDYKYGFGVLNTKKACDLININADINVITENSVKRGFKNIYTLKFSQPMSNLRFALAWMDPAGQSLVNDLDLKITSSTGKVYRPFVLDPDSPDSRATRGVNIVDNIELVRIQNVASAEVLTLEVIGKRLGKGTQQKYALVVN